MTAKIKLNAASGGGSISINAPSSAGSDTDFLDTSGNLAVSGTTTCTGNLKVGTITDTSGNNSSTTAEIAQGRAKVWIKMNGTGTIAINDSFGVSSIVDNGTGFYTINFSTAFASTNYCPVTALASYLLANSDRRYPLHIDQVETGLCKVLQAEVANNSSANDGNFICVAIFGDQ